MRQLTLIPRASLAVAALLIAVGLARSAMLAVLLVSALCVALFGLGAVVGLVRRDYIAVKRRLVAAALWTVVCGIAIGGMSLSAWWAAKHAETIIVACRAYERDFKSLPATLGALVPRYLPKVPRPTPVGGGPSGTYEYWVLEGDHRLSYGTVAPVARRIYRFESATWIFSDFYGDSVPPGAARGWPPAAR